MARLQILELPEGSSDDRPPFILVIDQVDDDLAQDIASWPENIAKRTGARQVLCFSCTIDIPANDTTAYLPEVEAQAEPRCADERAIQAEEKLKAFMEKRHAIEQEHKALLTDALDMDRIRDWDDIRNAATALRKERDTQAETLKQMRAGEEPFTDECVAPTPGQWIWKWNRATPEKRLDMAAQIFDAMPRSNTCLLADHETQIARLRDELARLRGETASVEAVTRQTPQGPRPGKIVGPSPNA